LPVTAENVYAQRVLVPGCGVGRLPLEICANGYSCEGNEQCVCLPARPSLLCLPEFHYVASVNPHSGIREAAAVGGLKCCY
jgi:hypothetical protein